MGAHYVIGIGIQFDDRTNLSLQVAILTKIGAPSNHAELMVSLKEEGEPFIHGILLGYRFDTGCLEMEEHG